MITLDSYPVVGTDGNYSNIFPSQKTLNAVFTRKDSLIDSISSGTDGNILITMTDDLETDSLSVGDYVSWYSEGYGDNRSKVTNLTGTNSFEVDKSFTTTNSTDGFVNYKQNWFLEVRYVSPDSVTDNQLAVEVLDDYSAFYPNTLGVINANIALPSQLIEPELSITNGVNDNLSVSYKIQYRESYDDNRENTWVSPNYDGESIDKKILLVHGTEDISEGFTDEGFIKVYTRFYPLMYSFIHSDINDTGSTKISIIVTEYSMSQSEISSYEVSEIENMNGVAIIAMDTNSLDSSTAFLKFSYTIETSNNQYDLTEYKGTEYS